MQRRLVGLGVDCGGDQPGHYGAGTEAAVSAFQAKRGLRVDGICGHESWNALVEAGWHLGDRLLYHRVPMLRGDDVAALQRRLGILGFDAGRVDGILGERTAAALVDFQRNAGLPPSGVCGPETIEALARLGERTGPEAVAGVRERDRLRRWAKTVAGLGVVLGDAGGLNPLVSSLGRLLYRSGARVVVLDHPDESQQAAAANASGADVFVGLALAEAGCSAAYYAVEGYESAGGRRLAELILEAVPASLGMPGGSVVPGGAVASGVRGMALPVLRETRMPAVLCELGPPPLVVERVPELSAALADVLGRWAESPCG